MKYLSVDGQFKLEAYVNGEKYAREAGQGNSVISATVQAGKLAFDHEPADCRRIF